MGRFEAHLSDEQALRAAGKAAKAASPEDPLKATQKQFDAVRGAYPGLPSARALCQRFQLSWSQLLRAACSPAGQQTRQASYGRRNTSRKGLTLDDCLDALRRVARKNSKARLTRADYQRLRAQMLGTKANKPGRSSLPTLNQLDTVLKQNSIGWLEAHELAGLDATPSPARRGHKRQRWSTTSILQGLRKAEGLLKPGETLTQRKLKDLAKTHDGIPGWKTVHAECNRQGVGFAELKARAS